MEKRSGLKSTQESTGNYITEIHEKSEDELHSHRPLDPEGSWHEHAYNTRE